MTRDDFEAELARMFDEAMISGKGSLIVEAGRLHRRVGGYPGNNHRMPVCCGVMRSEMVDDFDEVLYEPPKGNGASLRIEYRLRRPHDI